MSQTLLRNIERKLFYILSMYFRVQNFLKGKQKVGNKRKLRNILLSKRRKIQYKRKQFLYAIICSTALIFLYKKNKFTSLYVT
jgi:hypothetical protein